MRILYIARGLDDAGSFFVLQGLFAALRKRGDEVQLLNLDGKGAQVIDVTLAPPPATSSATPSAKPSDASSAAPARPSLLRRVRRFLFELAPATKIFLYDGLRSVVPQLDAIRRFNPDLIVDRENWVTVLIARWK